MTAPIRSRPLAKAPPAAPKIPFLPGPEVPQKPAPAAATTEPMRSEPGGRIERPQQRRRRWVKLSALVCIGLPTLLAALYYGLFAADQYSAEARFAIRGANAVKGVPDLLGVFGGSSGSGSVAGDSYIVMDYIRSREVLEKMAPMADIRAIYSNPTADYVARLDPTVSIEELAKYWRTMVELGYDASSQIVTIKVRAFTPAEAKQVLEAILRLSEELINALSDRARADAVRYAEQEVRRTEDRLKATRATLRTFRDQQQDIDPLKKAETQLTLLGRLEAELAAAKARLLTMRQYMGQTAPTVTYLENQIKALERQAEQERAKLGKGEAPEKGATLSGAVADYEELVVEREFAEKAYVAALAALERSHNDAAQQQRYIATFVTPGLPEEAQHPKRLTNTIIVLGISVLLWSLGLLIVYAVRDHAT
jgi:capsular polysaccharide transport system permease protein